MPDDPVQDKDDPAEEKKTSIYGLKSAADTAKQIITLSTGVTALTVTFADKFSPSTAAELVVPLSLKLSWGAFGLTILFGVVTLMAITGTLNEIDLGKKNPGAKAKNIQLPAALMVVFFLAGLGLTISSGAIVTNTGLMRGFMDCAE